jgi:hypothetical protein
MMVWDGQNYNWCLSGYDLMRLDGVIDRGFRDYGCVHEIDGLFLKLVFLIYTLLFMHTKSIKLVALNCPSFKRAPLFVESILARGGRKKQHSFSMPQVKVGHLPLLFRF